MQNNYYSIYHILPYIYYHIIIKKLLFNKLLYYITHEFYSPKANFL